MAWDQNNIEHQKNKTILITGANSGLGLASTKALLRKDAEIIMGCRDINYSMKTYELLKKEFVDSRLHLIEMDLSDLFSIQKATELIINKFKHIDILINNAGIMATPRQLSKQNIESQFAINHIGHMCLSLILLPHFKPSQTSRVVTVSSGIQYFGKINWDDINLEKKYDRWVAYAQSKIANVMFGIELNDFIKSKNLKLSSVVCHPGVSRTNLQLKSLNINNSVYEKFFYQLINPFFQSSQMGALPQLYAATSKEALGGHQYCPRYGFRGDPIQCSSARYAMNKQNRVKLWELSKYLIEKSINI